MTETQRWLVNPKSGNGAGGACINALSSRADITVEALDFHRLDEQLKREPLPKLLVIAGGDGTFSSVLTSHSLPRVPVATVPLGTANDLSRELGLSRLVSKCHMSEMPGLLAHLPVRSLATWELRSGSRIVPFCNYASIGYEGSVVCDFSRWRSHSSRSGKLINRVMYSWFGLTRALSRLHGISVCSAEGQSIPCRTAAGLSFCNIKSQLGLGISNSASSAHDDTIECVVVSSVFTYARMLAAQLGLLRAPIPLLQSGHIIVKNIAPNTALQVDGEAAAPLEAETLEIVFRRFVTVAYCPPEISLLRRAQPHQ